MATNIPSYIPLDHGSELDDADGHTQHHYEPDLGEPWRAQPSVQSNQREPATTYMQNPNWGASDVIYQDRHSHNFGDDAQGDDFTSGERIAESTTTQNEATLQLKSKENLNEANFWQLPTRAVIERDFWWFMSWVFDVILTLTPLCFIVAAAIALRLDHQSKSSLGEELLKATQLGPTVFPVIFAAIIGQFCRNLSRWRLEQPYGIKLGALEQINGSQSLSSAIERVFTVRSTQILPLCIVLVWAMSPIGGQSSLRLLSEGQDPVTSQSEIYFANPEYQTSVFEGGSETSDYTNPTFMLYSSLLFSVPASRAALTDPWDRPKLPQLPRAVIETSDYSWHDFDQDINLKGGEDFTSLLGVDIQGIRIDDNTMVFDFAIEMSYIDMDCERVIRHKTSNMTSTYRGQTTSFVAALENYTSSGDPESWYWNSDKAGHRLYYNSRISYEVYSNPTETALFECIMRRIPIESEIRCGPFPSTGCGVRRQRQREDKFDPMSAHITSGGWTPPDDWYQILPWSLPPPTLSNILARWPAAAGPTDPTEEASATDNFLAGDDFLYQSQHLRDWDHDASNMTLFSRRMTTLFNTMFHATLNPWNVTKTDMTRIPSPAGDTLIDIQSPVYNTTRYTSTRQQVVYLANNAWCATLLIVSSILQILAIANLCLRTIINAPDILGFASSLTRDSPYFPLRPSGSALGGAERARLLKNVRVQVADVIPTENIGYIAFRPVFNGLVHVEEGADDKGVGGQSQRRIGKDGRLYA